jgi:hypothetical protein
LRDNKAAVRCGSGGSSRTGHNPSFSLAIAIGSNVASRPRRTISTTALMD